VLLLNVPEPLDVHVNVDALPPTEPPSVTDVPPQMIASIPALAVAGVLMVTDAVDDVAEQPPPAAMLFVTVYVPGVDAERLICPVVVLTNTNPAGVAENVPALDPAGNVGEGFVPLWQKGPA
jgi:hypothetical protein